MPHPIHLVPHTHWDREWYLPFEGFLARLMPVMDMVLGLLESGDEWRFHLDGQTAMVDDYLAVRPERRDELYEYVKAGRLSCGPWITLVDEFLVSGESIIRNLEDGIARAEAMGSAMRIGYMPDQFGHISQMPQIFRSFGIETAVVWRGVPAAITRTRFRWRAPDGSAVDAQYLPFGYGQGAALPVAERDFIERLLAEEARTEPFLDDGESMLLMAGDDHESPVPRLPALVSAARAAGLDAAIGTLEEHAGGMPRPEQEWSGELRSSARANLLPNTYSVRPQQKAERARAEHLLERYAEPLAALVPGEPWPDAELDEAWALLHMNGAHDSVCGCSTDEVARAVDGRTRRATEIAEAILERGLARLAASCGSSGTVIFNPSPFERSGVPALGWVCGDVFLPEPQPVELWVRGNSVVIGDGEAVLRFEDRGDEGDLYTFCPSEQAREPDDITVVDGIVHSRFGRCDVSLWAEAVTGESFTRLHGTLENRAPDHRVRMVVELPEAAERTIAGSPFELVERPRLQEGGASEAPSPYWPARGLVVASGRGVLAGGVFEYELTGDALAVTLARCTGLISRTHSLATRNHPAGPGVATPEAQLPGRTPFDLAILTSDPGERVVETWEQYALALMAATARGGGRLPDRGSLIEIEAPALSSVRRIGDEIRIGLWNPWARACRARVGAVELQLGPCRIASVRAEPAI